MPSSRAWVSNLVIATSCNSASQAVKIEETMMQRKLGCILLQKDAISDANLRLGQWQDIVDPRQLMNGILAEVQKLASIDSHESALFAVSMHIFMCLAPPQSQTVCVSKSATMWPALKYTGIPSTLASLHSHVVLVPSDWPLTM